MSKRYKRYYGRKRSRAGITFLWIVLLVLLALTIGAIIVLRDYVEYDESGKAYINLPFLQTASPSPSPGGASPPPADPVTPAPTPTPTPVPPSPTPTPRRTDMQAAFVPFDMVKAGAALDALASAVQNGTLSALVVEVKPESGQLLYPSALPLAVKAGVSAESEDAMAVIASLRNQNVPLIACLSCFKDATVPQKDAAVGVKHTSGVNWLDGGKTRWLNPYQETARQYILDIISELADMGFDGVLLTHVNFPYVGGIQSISYGNQTLGPAGQMSAFLADARKIADDRGITLSCLIDETALTAPASGLEAQTLFAACDTVLMPVALNQVTEDGSALRGRIAPLVSGASLTERLGLMLTTPDNLSREALDVALGQAGDNWLIRNDKLIYPMP